MGAKIPTPAEANAMLSDEDKVDIERLREQIAKALVSFRHGQKVPVPGIVATPKAVTAIIVELVGLKWKVEVKTDAKGQNFEISEQPTYSSNDK